MTVSGSLVRDADIRRSPILIVLLLDSTLRPTLDLDIDVREKSIETIAPPTLPPATALQLLFTSPPLSLLPSQPLISVQHSILLILAAIPSAAQRIIGLFSQPLKPMGPSATKMSHKPIDPIKDSRVTHNYTTLNGRKYRGLPAVPPRRHLLTSCQDYVQGQKIFPAKATAMLIHGFPDLWCMLPVDWIRGMAKMLLRFVAVYDTRPAGHGPAVDCSRHDWIRTDGMPCHLAEGQHWLTGN